MMHRTCCPWGCVLVLALLTGGFAVADPPSVWSRLWPLGKKPPAESDGPHAHRHVGWPVSSRHVKSTAGKQRDGSPFGRLAELPKRWWHTARGWLPSSKRKTARQTSLAKQHRRHSGLFRARATPRPPRTTKEFFAQKRPTP